MIYQVFRLPERILAFRQPEKVYSPRLFCYHVNDVPKNVSLI
ncbi:hypothetical protein ACKLNO_06810 [Neisseriaceae bacterium B1]